MPNDLQNQINQLKATVEALQSEVSRNNFIGSQDFNKYVRFNSRLKVPTYTSLPTTCEVGEVIEVAGKLRICSVANVYTIVGTQT